MNSKIKYLKGLIFVFGILLGFTGFSHHTFAEDVSFSVNPKPTDKQLDTSVSYYDLKLNPSEKTTMVVTVKNNSKKPITIETNVDKATTNPNGVVEYNNSSHYKSSNLKYDISQLIKISETSFEVPAEGTKDLTYILESPTETFQGSIVGGINFIEESKHDKEKDSKKKTGMAINNRYAYTVAVVLHGESELETNDVSSGKIKVNQINGRNKIYFPIKNESARFLNRTNVTAKVYQKNSDKKETVYEEEKKEAQVAPNSVYDFPIGTKEEKLKAGEYIAVMEISSKGQKWKFTEEFEISNKKAKKLNKSSVVKDNKYSPYIYFGIGIALLAIVLIVAIVLYGRKKNKQIEELKRKGNE